MIRITITLLPGGREDGQKEIGRMEIAKVGDGRYKGRLYRRGSAAMVQKSGFVEKYPSSSYSVWVLVYRMLRELLRK